MENRIKKDEHRVQNDMTKALLANGWPLNRDAYHRKLAFYPEEIIGFVRDSQTRRMG